MDSLGFFFHLILKRFLEKLRNVKQRKVTKLKMKSYRLLLLGPWLNRSESLTLSTLKPLYKKVNLVLNFIPSIQVCVQTLDLICSSDASAQTCRFFPSSSKQKGKTKKWFDHCIIYCLVIYFVMKTFNQRKNKNRRLFTSGVRLWAPAVLLEIYLFLNHL